MTDHSLTGPLEKVRGVIGREPTGDDRYIFEFDDVRDRDVHMVGVRNPLRVTWLAEGEVTLRRTLRPWIGYASARADRIIEEAAAPEVGR